MSKKANKVVEAVVEEVEGVMGDAKDTVKNDVYAKENCETPRKYKRTKWVVLALIVAMIATWSYMQKHNIKSVGEVFDGGLRTVSVVDANNKEQFSYAIGVKIGEQLDIMMKQQGDEDVSREVVAQAISDTITARDTAMTTEQVEELMVAREAIEKEKFEKKAEEALATGEAFMIEYAAGEGVTKLDGDVLVKELTVGTGALVGKQTAQVYYRGKLTDGTEFDSSYKYGEEPIAFNAEQVVPGFGTALSVMSVGDKWEIVIPSDQAYGPMGTPDGAIGPNETLIFELEIAGIE